jgi:hypothetical protein
VGKINSLKGLTPKTFDGKVGENYQAKKQKPSP